MSQIVAFADLDDTLFQTLRKLPGVNPSTLTPATVNTQGEAHSYCTPAQVTLQQWLTQRHVTFIPVTGRDWAAMQRVNLPFSSWRVLDHGLTILDPTGHPEAAWAAAVQAQLLPLQAELRAFTQEVRGQVAALGCRLSVHYAHGLPFMSVIKHPDADPAALQTLQNRWRLAAHQSPLHVIANANNVSLLPRAVGKAQAVRYLRQQHFAGASLTLGLGDSVSDLPFMRECDFALTPTQGQLLRALHGLELPQC